MKCEWRMSSQNINNSGVERVWRAIILSTYKSFLIIWFSWKVSQTLLHRNIIRAMINERLSSQTWIYGSNSDFGINCIWLYIWNYDNKQHVDNQLLLINNWLLIIVIILLIWYFTDNVTEMIHCLCWAFCSPNFRLQQRLFPSSLLHC